MKNALIAIAVVMLAVLVGCSKTKTVTIYSENNMIIGEQMSCVYHGDNLYCTSPLVKAADIDQLQLMTKVVSLVNDLTRNPKDSGLKQSGSFSTKFGTNPKEYSLWNCSNTGVAEPAVKCILLREADPKLVGEQEQDIKLNHAQESKLVYNTTEQSIITSCGAPIERKKDMISRTVTYPSTHKGILVEVRFNTIRETKLDGITTVDEDTRKFHTLGILWNNYVSIGSNNEDRVPPIRDYFPCILK